MFITGRQIVLRALTTFQPGLKFISRGMTTWVPSLIVCTAIAFWRITADIETIGPRVICAVACLAAMWAARSGGYYCMAAFAGIAVIFNPFVPDMISRIAIFGLYFVLAAMALLGLAISKLGTYRPAPIALAVQRRIMLDCRQGQTL